MLVQSGGESMSKPRTPISEGDHDRDAQTIALLVALIHARRTGDYLRAASAHADLERRGVLVKFSRNCRGDGRAVRHAR
jgi:hypothetical protein